MTMDRSSSHTDATNLKHFIMMCVAPSGGGEFHRHPEDDTTLQFSQIGWQSGSAKV